MVVVIIDFAHAGTTMLAGVLEHLGVPMVGERYVPHKLEDLEVIEAIREGEETFAAVVAQRDARHPVWGFKYPGAWKFWPMLDKCLTDPVYLAIYKDVVSVTRRRFGKSDARWLKKLRSTSRQMMTSIDGLYKCGVSLVTFSYYRAILDPAQFVAQVAEAVGLDPSVEQAARAVGSIKPNTRGPRAPYPKVER